MIVTPTNVLLVRKLGDFSRETFDAVIGSLIPFYDTRVQTRHGDESSLEETSKKLISRARKCLLYNLSFLIEPKTRSTLLLILEEWVDGHIDYDTARLGLEKAIGERSKIAKVTIPAQAIAHVLVSFGFFSTAFILQSKQAPMTANSIGHLLTTILSNSPARAQKLLKASRYLRKGDVVRFEHEMKRLGHGPKPIEASSERALIIGPGPESSNPERTEFDEVVVLVGPNANLKEVGEIVRQHKCSIFINSEMAKQIIDGSATPGWISVLSEASMIKCKRGQSKDLARLSGRHVERVSRIWDIIWASTGDPNMVQVAGQNLIEKNFQIVVEGADLYVGSTLYSNEANLDKVNNARDEFHLCSSFAQHNAVMNFVFIQWLARGGWLIGSNRMLGIARMDLETYLRVLDKNLGENRR